MIHLKDYTNTINHVPSKSPDLEYDQIYHNLWGGFAAYIGKYAKNKSKENFNQGNKTASKKSFIGIKVARTFTSIKDVSQGRTREESDIFFEEIWSYRNNSGPKKRVRI